MKEKGTIRYDYFSLLRCSQGDLWGSPSSLEGRSKSHRGKFTLLERWTDQAALDVHHN